MTWYVHRRPDGTIASRHQELQPGYAEEALAVDAGEMRAWEIEHGLEAHPAFDDASKARPRVSIAQELRFDTANGKAPAGIDIAAILVKRRERAKLEDERRVSPPAVLARRVKKRR